MKFQPEYFMSKALLLAKKGLGRTSPNPPVGAVVVRDNKIVGEGCHPGAGQPHAEIIALQQAGELASGSDLYVTLEPCCHTGRTGPCTKAIIEAGIAKIYVGTIDPNPKVSGHGIEQLKEAGVEVELDLYGLQCSQLIAPFTKHVQTGLPYVVYKAAMTLDGQIATFSGDSQWISCLESRTLVHQLRNQVDGILVGAGTVLKDNPRLTTRLVEEGRDPLRIVIDRSLSTPPESQVFSQDSLAKTLLVTSLAHSRDRLTPYSSGSVDFMQVPCDGSIADLRRIFDEFGRMNLQYLLFEGGSRLAGALLEARLIDRLMIFVAPCLLGGQGKNLFGGKAVDCISEAFKLKNLSARKIGNDILLEGEVLNVYWPD
jgi:diaminohydroxyphosphoribosylaminopyrimidine deaminase/5-amino-6-(5-phosphoribosylamino)uracil reductase